MNIIDRDRKDILKEYPNFIDFKKDFVIPETYLTELIDNAKKENITFNETQFNKSKELLMLQMKALIARDVWTMNEYFEVINAENESLKKALEIISNPIEYQKILSTSKVLKGNEKKKH
jgi:carboxyl-terminal processing protease